jgi:hypothetical protein
MAPKRTRSSLPDDPDKDPWTSTQVGKAYGGHVTLAGTKGLGIEPASRERWMAVKTALLRGRSISVRACHVPTATGAGSEVPLQVIITSGCRHEATGNLFGLA